MWVYVTRTDWWYEVHIEKVLAGVLLQLIVADVNFKRVSKWLLCYCPNIWLNPIAESDIFRISIYLVNPVEAKPNPSLKLLSIEDMVIAWWSGTVLEYATSSKPSNSGTKEKCFITRSKWVVRIMVVFQSKEICPKLITLHHLLYPLLQHLQPGEYHSNPNLLQASLRSVVLRFHRNSESIHSARETNIRKLRISLCAWQYIDQISNINPWMLQNRCTFKIFCGK